MDDKKLTFLSLTFLVFVFVYSWITPGIQLRPSFLFSSEEDIKNWKPTKFYYAVGIISVLFLVLYEWKTIKRVFSS